MRSWLLDLLTRLGALRGSALESAVKIPNLVGEFGRNGGARYGPIRSAEGIDGVEQFV